MKGGHARSGPAPDPNALRRDRPEDRAGWVTLPVEGRTGDEPAWPLESATPRESHLWAAMWVKPQAVEWERQGQVHEVALYVRRLAEAERPNTPTNLSTLVRQMSDSLGLTTPGLRSNRWRIGSVSARTDRPAARAPSRTRLKVVAVDAVEGTEQSG